MAQCTTLTIIAAVLIIITVCLLKQTNNSQEGYQDCTISPPNNVIKTFLRQKCIAQCPTDSYLESCIDARAKPGKCLSKDDLISKLRQQCNAKPTEAEQRACNDRLNSCFATPVTDDSSKGCQDGSTYARLACFNVDSSNDNAKFLMCQKNRSNYTTAELIDLSKQYGKDAMIGIRVLIPGRKAYIDYIKASEVYDKLMDGTYPDAFMPIPGTAFEVIGPGDPQICSKLASQYDIKTCGDLCKIMKEPTNAGNDWGRWACEPARDELCMLQNCPGDAKDACSRINSIYGINSLSEINKITDSKLKDYYLKNVCYTYTNLLPKTCDDFRALGVNFDDPSTFYKAPMTGTESQQAFFGCLGLPGWGGYIPLQDMIAKLSKFSPEAVVKLVAIKKLPGGGEQNVSYPKVVVKDAIKFIGNWKPQDGSLLDVVGVVADKQYMIQTRFGVCGPSTNADATSYVRTKSNECVDNVTDQVVTNLSLCGVETKDAVQMVPCTYADAGCNPPFANFPKCADYIANMRTRTNATNCAIMDTNRVDCPRLDALYPGPCGSPVVAPDAQGQCPAPPPPSKPTPTPPPPQPTPTPSSSTSSKVPCLPQGAPIYVCGGYAYGLKESCMQQCGDCTKTRQLVSAALPNQDVCTLPRGSKVYSCTRGTILKDLYASEADWKATQPDCIVVPLQWIGDGL